MGKSPGPPGAGERRSDLMLTGGVGGEAPRAGGPSSLRLRPPLQGEREREEEEGCELSEEGRKAGEVAWLGQRLGRRTLGKEGVAVPPGASKIATHPMEESRERLRVEPGVAARGQQWLGASEDLGGPHKNDRIREGREEGQLGHLPGLGRGGWGPIAPRVLPGGQRRGLQ